MNMVLRRIDELGRVVIPADARKALGLLPGAEVALCLEGDTLTLRNAGAVCKLCGAKEEIDSRFGICAACLREIRSVPTP